MCKKLKAHNQSLIEKTLSFRRMVREEAVVIKNAMKRYTRKGNPVLDNLNMKVSRGNIYGLLGASGCGKTTLLSCVVGVRFLDSGELWVLGGKPSSKESGIPGPRVGYMPQEIALVGEFTVNNALYYFGRINGLEEDEIKPKVPFLSELLELPPRNRLIKNMSGGQQRRVSFACTLIHMPELLILDEPTVGLDPMLRDKIWVYLKKITQEEGISVVITTHYIEETKDANRIGLMRNGKLLAESPPNKLLERFHCELLEEAFLKLCVAQDNQAILDAAEPEEEDTDSEWDQDEEPPEYKGIRRGPAPRLKKCRALLVKNSAQFFRYYTGLIFAIVFPIMQVSLFYLVIGDDPQNLEIGIINNEAGRCDDRNFTIWKDDVTCHFGNISCRFLNSFDDKVAKKIYFDNIEDALDEAKDGDIRGIIYFGSNFSQALQMRLDDAFFAMDYDLAASEIPITLDMGDLQVGLFLQRKLFSNFIKVYEDIMKDCSYPIKMADPPIRFEEPVYGGADLTYTDFMVTVYLLSLMMFLAVTVSTTLIITDRLEGLWDRSVVQGVNTYEIVLSHVFVQSFVIIAHATILVCSIPISDTNYKGSLLPVSIFMFLTGFVGLLYGFVISCFCNNHTMANMVSAGSFFPLIVLCGGLWPLEGIPGGLRWFAWALPVTLPGVSVRAIMYKNLEVSDPEVWIGYFVSVGWIIILFILMLVGVKLKS